MLGVDVRHFTEQENRNARDEKIKIGTDFIESLKDLPILFGGISGSVSYEPDPTDDIDIFLIVQQKRLWYTILKSFLRRRRFGSADICLSLFMSENHALQFYRTQKDPLISEDAVRAVPVIGEQYYSYLLSQSDYIREKYNLDRTEGIANELDAIEHSPVEVILFLFLGTFLKLKGLIRNRTFRKSGRLEETFLTRISPDFMILDSLKYRRLRMERLEDVLDE